MQLIKEGASVVTSAKDALDFYGIHSQFSISNFQSISNYQISKPSTSLEEKILEQLRAEPKEVDELARLFGMSAAHIGSALSFLELSGAITKEGGKYYAQ